MGCPPRSALACVDDPGEVAGDGLDGGGGAGGRAAGGGPGVLQRHEVVGADRHQHHVGRGHLQRHRATGAELGQQLGAGLAAHPEVDGAGGATGARRDLRGVPVHEVGAVAGAAGGHRVADPDDGQPPGARSGPGGRRREVAAAWDGGGDRGAPVVPDQPVRAAVSAAIRSRPRTVRGPRRRRGERRRCSVIVRHGSAASLERAGSADAGRERGCGPSGTAGLPLPHVR